MASVDPFLAEITAVALAVAEEHGFALGGGNALVLHGVVNRPTADVDLFTDRDGSVRAAAALVQGALESAGLTVTEVVRPSELDGLIEGLDDYMVEFDVARGARVAGLSLAIMPRTRRPVIMEIGPVMVVDDLVPSKIAALVNRREVRDYIDAAALLADRTPQELLAEARRVDRGIEDGDVASAGRFFDAMPDEVFAEYGLTDPAGLVELRRRFDSWPR